MNNQTWKVSAADTGVRLDKWLAAAERLGSRSKSLAAIEKGKIFVNDAEQSVADAGRKLNAGESVRLWMDRPGSSERRYSERRTAGLHIIYEDSALMVLNKPAGLLAVPLASQPDEPSLFDEIAYYLRSTKREPLVVHRIDRDTSGLVVFAKTGEAQRLLKEQFEKRDATRIYLAVVYGVPNPDSGIWKDLIEWDKEELKQQQVQEKTRKAHEAICRYQVLEKLPAARPEASLIEVRLVSGKRNQIRIQAGLRGHPLVGEKMYVYENPARRIEFPRQALHAHKLSFKHPTTGNTLNFESPMPEDMQKLLPAISNLQPVRKAELKPQSDLIPLKPATKANKQSALLPLKPAGKPRKQSALVPLKPTGKAKKQSALIPLKPAGKAKKQSALIPLNPAGKAKKQSALLPLKPAGKAKKQSALLPLKPAGKTRKGPVLPPLKKSHKPRSR